MVLLSTDDFGFFIPPCFNTFLAAKEKRNQALVKVCI